VKPRLRTGVSGTEDVQKRTLRVRERTRDLQQANAAKTRFIAAASHDLRQPVVTIGLLVGLLREQIASPQLRGMMDRVNEAVAALEALLKGLLDLSRFDAGIIRPRPQPVALQPLFDAIVAHEGEAARLKGLSLRFRATGVVVQSDPVLLEQIVRNLVNNAVRYTDRGGVLVGLRRRGRERVLLQVWDTGWGIPPSQHDAVFEEFAQLGTGRDRVRGLGLGLALVKRAAVLLDHPLRLHSVPQRGSCFSLELPVTHALPQPQAMPEPERQPLAGVGIVLVEDESAVREAMSLQLRRWGARVETFDGLPALEQALQAHTSNGTQPAWDLLVSDNRLPGADSLCVIGRVRRACGALPALVVTGDTSPSDLAALTESGVPVLHKPFRAAELLAAIESARADEVRA
jgi:CheY-like chemotaxis protein